jgi:hypothetical protein
VTKLIGERAVARYIKHPNADASGLLSNGWPIDSGTIVRTLDNNTHHLQHEALRPLVWSNGSGDTDIITTFEGQFAGLPDYTVPPTLGAAHQNIPWDRRTSARFPAFLIADYDLDTGEASIRPIRMSLRATLASGVSPGAAHFAVTFSSASPYTNPPFMYESASVISNVAIATLVPDSPASAQTVGSVMRCRHAPTNGTSTRVTTILGYLWFGWSFYGASVVAASRIESMSAWEVWS